MNGEAPRPKGGDVGLVDRGRVPGAVDEDKGGKGG